jgi:hypothetical protein
VLRPSGGGAVPTAALTVYFLRLRVFIAGRGRGFGLTIDRGPLDRAARSNDR